MPGIAVSLAPSDNTCRTLEEWVECWKVVLRKRSSPKSNNFTEKSAAEWELLENNEKARRMQKKVADLKNIAIEHGVTLSVEKSKVDIASSIAKALVGSLKAEAAALKAEWEAAGATLAKCVEASVKGNADELGEIDKALAGLGIEGDGHEDAGNGFRKLKTVDGTYATAMRAHCFASEASNRLLLGRAEVMCCGVDRLLMKSLKEDHAEKPYPKLFTIVPDIPKNGSTNFLSLKLIGRISASTTSMLPKSGQCPYGYVCGEVVSVSTTARSVLRHRLSITTIEGHCPA